MAKLPTDEAVRARAEQLGLVQPGQPLDRTTHRSVAKDLLAEATAAENAPKVPAGAPSVVPLASLNVEVSGLGLLHIDVTLTPPKEK